MMRISVNTPWIGDGASPDTAYRPQITYDYKSVAFSDSTNHPDGFSDPSVYAIEVDIEHADIGSVAVNSGYYINWDENNRHTVPPDSEFTNLHNYLLTSRFTQSWIDSAIGTSVAGRTRDQITNDLIVAFKALPKSDALLKYDSPTLGNTVLHNDLSVTTDGVPNNNAVVSFVNERYRIDVDGNGIINANPVPGLGNITVTREPGWQGNLGYRVVLNDWAEGTTPNAIALAIYNSPDGNDYSYTTGAMQWDAEAEHWYAVCPAGFEPGQNDIYMGFLYGSLNISAFTMQAQWDEQTFSGGGDWA